VPKEMNCERRLVVDFGTKRPMKGQARGREQVSIASNFSQIIFFKNKKPQRRENLFCLVKWSGAKEFLFVGGEGRKSLFFFFSFFLFVIKK